MEAFRHANNNTTNFSVIDHSIGSQSTPTTSKPTHTNTFVHKLFNMVIDDQFQHLIAWSYTGSSFIVCNIMEFSKDVLPKHFKHNNFSSFVRQLNMYGFHKVNKSPRGHRTLAENQIWEFSHQKFLRNRPDLLDDIKRKAMEVDTKSNGDMHTHMAMIQMSQTDIIQQMNHLYEKFNQVVKELTETKKKQSNQDYMIKQLLHYISQQNGGQLPSEIKNDPLLRTSLNATSLSIENNNTNNDQAPSIFITSHESTNDLHTSTHHSFTNHHHHHHNNNSNNNNNNNNSNSNTNSPTLPSPLTVRTQNVLSTSPSTSSSSSTSNNNNNNNYHHHHQSIPSTLSPLSTSFTSSLTSTNSGLIPSDDDASLYSPHTPKDNNSHNSILFQRHACK